MEITKWFGEEFQVLYFNSGSGSNGGESNWLEAPGLFLFVGQSPEYPERSANFPLFVGTAQSLYIELPIQRKRLAGPAYSLNVVHVRVEHDRDKREGFARALIDEYKPPLNVR